MSTRYLNELEPPGLVRHLLQNPPEGFAAIRSKHGTPGFCADFDLLTTADPDTRRWVHSLPGSRWLRPCLNWRTTFFGSTASEYFPAPADIPPASLLRSLLDEWAGRTQLLILKDIPKDSTLLPEADRAHATLLAASCRESGFVMVEGQALAYVGIDFDSPEHYLARLSPGRRKDIRRKLRAREKVQVEIWPTGCQQLDDPHILDTLYALYLEVYGQSEIHFDKLTPEFFRAVLQDESLDGRLFLYHGEQGLIGFNLCFVHGGMLIDKYVGFRYPAARDHNLYFLSWMENLAYARAHGLSHYVAGWTDPEIKAYLGARFTFTRHAVYVRNPLLRAVLQKISGHFESDRTWFDAQAKPAPSAANP